MKKSIVGKGLVLGIIVLFVGASVAPSISGDVFEQDTSIDTSENIYNEDVNNEVNNETYSIPLIVFIKDELDNSLKVASAEIGLDWSKVSYWDGSKWSSIPGHSSGIIHAGDNIVANRRTINLKWIPTNTLLGSWTFKGSELKSDKDREIGNLYLNMEPKWIYSDGGNVISTSVSADGEYIAVKTSYNIHLFSKNSNDPIWSKNTGNNMGWTAISSDGSYIAASAYNQLRYYNGAGTLLWSHSISGFINCLSMSSNGEYIVIGGYDSHMVYLFHKDSSTPVWTYTTDGQVWSVDISSDGNYIVSGCYYDHNLYFFHRSSSTPQWNYTSNDYFSAESAAISSNGDYISAGDTDGIIFLFGKDSNNPIWTYSTGGNYIRGIDISSDGNYIVAGSADPNNLHFFQKDDGNPQWIFTGATDNYKQICISSNGKYIAGGCDSGDKHIYYFNKDSSDPVWSYQTGSLVWTVSMSANGEYTVGGGNDKNLRFFHYLEGMKPDLTVLSDDIMFSKDSGEITLDVKIHNYHYKSTSDVDYWLIDIYNNLETLIESDTISTIASNGYKVISKTLSIENPENHIIKVVVDPYDNIEESNEENNVAIRKIIFFGFILTTISYKNVNYYVMFRPREDTTWDEVTSLFNNENPSFANGIKELWIVNSNNEKIRNTGEDNKIGNILYKAIETFNNNNANYLHNNVYHSIENAEIIANNVRNRWLFDILSLTYWFEEIFGGDKEEMIKFWDYTIMGPAAKYVPEVDTLRNLIGASFAIISFVSTMESHWGDSTLENYDDLSYVDVINKFKTFLKRSKVDTSKGLVTFYDPIDGSEIIAEIVDYDFLRVQDLTLSENFLKMIDYLNEEDFVSYIVDVAGEYSSDVISLLDYQKFHIAKAFEKLNRLKVLRDAYALFDPNAEYLQELDASIRLAKIEASVMLGLINPEDVPEWKVDIARPLLDAIVKSAGSAIFKEVIKQGIKQSTIFILRQVYGISTIWLGPSLGWTSAATIAGYATAVLAGWDLGLTIVNWGEVKRFADIAKLNAAIGLYTIDTPTYLLSTEPDVNNKPLYSNVLKSIKTLEVGSSYYNMGVSKDSLWFGLTGYFGWGDDWYDAGDYCYEKVEFVEEFDKVFPLFNKLSSLYELEDGSNEDDIFTVPRMNHDVALDIETAKKDIYLMNIGSGDGGWRWYCTNFDLLLDITTTKLNNKYFLTVDPYEEAHGLLGGDEIVNQIDNDEDIKFTIYNWEGDSFDDYWSDYYPTNKLHNKWDTEKWHESPFTVELPWEPYWMEAYYRWWNDPWFDEKYAITKYIGFSLPSISGESSIFSEKPTKRSINVKTIKGGSENVTYFTWDSNNDTFDDAMTVSWNISGYQPSGNVTLSARIIGGNVEANASTEGFFLAPQLNEDIFTFDFYANRTTDYEVYLYIINSTSLKTIDDRVLTGINLTDGPGDQSPKEKITNISYFTSDEDDDLITESFNLTIFMNSTDDSGNNSLTIICANSTGELIDIQYYKLNLSSEITNLTYSLSDLEHDSYSVDAYLYDGNFKEEDRTIIAFDIGENLSKIFTNEFVDYGNDTNSNMLFDYLSIRTGVNINNSGNYTFEGLLRNSSNRYVGEVIATEFLTEGLHNITLNFNSSLLTIPANNDSYVLVKLSLINESGKTVALYSPNYQTQFYNISSFEDPEVSFTSFNDYGVDTNSDGFYDYLVINVDIFVNSPSNYSFELELSNSTGNLSIYGWNTTYLPPGSNTLRFDFDGIILRDLMKNNSYQVDSIEVMNEDMLFIGALYPSWTLNQYDYSDFQPVLEILDSYLESLVDTNSNGLYEYLAITADMNVTILDNYTVKARLYSSDEILVDTFEEVFNLSSGIQNVTLLFNGSSLYRNMNNTYYVLKDLMVYYFPGRLADSRDIAYFTQTYNYSQFEPTEILDCWGVYDEGVDSDNNGLYEYLLVNISVTVSTPGNYHLRSYLSNQDGDFICIASNSSSMTTGEQFINLFFSGPMINYRQINTSYNLSIVDIYGEGNQLIFIDENVYTTSYYSYSQFESMKFPDLEISRSDIGLSKKNPEINESIFVNATIHNKGNANTSGVMINLYDGDKIDEAFLIDVVMIPFINSFDSVTVTIPWRFHENYTIHVVIDPSNYVSEINESNNYANFSIPNIVDYSPNISYTGVSFTFNTRITDNMGVSSAWVEYWYGNDTSHLNESMTPISGDDYYEKTITIPYNSTESLHYIITANNTANIWINIEEKNVPVIDNIYPEWQNMGQNGTTILPGGSILYAQGRDNIALNWSWLATNETGEWQNFTRLDWIYRMEISINNTMIESDLENFPILFKHSSSNFSTHAQVDGDDFLFTTEDGTLLNHEIEKWDVSSGELIGWVNVTSLSSTENTVLYLYYGNPSCDNQQNVEDTWDSDYVMVQHLNEISGDHKDSTINGVDITVNSMTGQGTGTGIAGKCNDFERNNGDGLTTDDIGNHGQFTVECWTDFESLVNYEQIFVDIDYCPHIVAYSDGHLHGGNAGGTSPGVVTTENWHYLTNTGDGTTAKVYVDAVEKASGSQNSGMGEDLEFGRYTGFDYYYDGLMDEIRCSKVARSDNWIKTTYNTISSPSSFFSVGIEENLRNNPYGSPIEMEGNDEWQWTNFTWQNSSIPVGTVVGWRIYYNDTSGNVNCTDIMNFTIIADTVPPEISNVAAYPNPQQVNGYVNITCTVADNAVVDIVMVNITGPAGFIPVNVSMINIPGTDTYCYNSTYTNTGTYNYFIWANDTNRHTNTSATYTFTIQDTTLPEILDNTPSIGYTGDPFTFNATITDNTEVPTVWVEYWYGTGSHTNVSMNNVAGDYWEKTIVIDDALDILHYIISANDTSNNWNNTGVKDVTISDNDDPEIRNVQAIPPIQNIGGYVNISAVVTDNIEVDEVFLYIEYPDSIIGKVNLKKIGKSIATKRGTIENFSITQNKTGNTYYCNRAYGIVGIHTYHIWANDTSGNSNVTADYTFEIINQPPNTPSQPSGPTSGYICISYDYSTSTTDPDGDNVKYGWDWDDGSPIEWSGWYSSGVTCTMSHSWDDPGTYDVRVKAKDIYDDESGWSNPLSVTMENHPPNTPSNPNPAHGATDVNVEAGLSWTGGDPDSCDTVTYDVYFGTTSPPPKVASNQSATTYDPGIMDYNTQYYWMIVAWDNHGASTEGPTWHFTTEEAPVPNLNCDGTLSWINVVPDATVTGNFTVENIGELGSLLDWEIDDYPDWGIWTFTPSSGDDLKPEDGPVIIEVTVIAPNQQNEEFTGNVTIVNKENSSDFCTIDVSLATPVSQPSPQSQSIFNIHSFIKRLML